MSDSEKPDYRNMTADDLRPLAENGDADAQNNLGFCYANGKGVARDFTQAVEWYRKAADQGNAFAQNNLGFCYYHGRGVACDFAQAVEWFRKAADQGNHYALRNLFMLCGEMANSRAVDDAALVRFGQAIGIGPKPPEGKPASQSGGTQPA